MARVEWGHLCDYAFFDEKKKACLIGIFSSIFTAHVPLNYFRCSFIFSLTGKSHEKVKVKLVILRPGGKDPLVDINNPGLALSETGSLISNIILDKLPLPDYGSYEINVYLNDKIAHTTTFQVSRVPQAKDKTTAKNLN